MVVVLAALVAGNNAVLNVDDAMRVLGDIVLVRDQNDRVALGMQTIEQRHDLDASLRVEVPVGSSARMIDGLLTSARAIATRCRCPPESSFGLCSCAIPCPRLPGSLGALDAFFGRHAGIDQRQLDIVQRGGAGQKVERLEHEADFLVANARQFIVIQFADQWPLSQYLPCSAYRGSRSGSSASICPNRTVP